jgi:hypothetical protein
MNVSFTTLLIIANDNRILGFNILNEDDLFLWQAISKSPTPYDIGHLIQLRFSPRFGGFFNSRDLQRP